MNAPTRAPDLANCVPARAARPVAELATGARWQDLPHRDLDRVELLALAASVAADPGLWREQVAFVDGAERHYACLHRTAHVEVWVLCWTPSNDTGWHDHDISSGAVVVTQGCLVEDNLALGSASVTTEVPAGLGYSFGPEHIHRLGGRDGVPGGSVSVHAYSPPLWRMGYYEVDAAGVLRRTSVSYPEGTAG